MHSMAGQSASLTLIAYFSAAMTAVACSSGLKPLMTALTFPSGPITNVVRSIPIYLRPYMLFSLSTSNFFAMALLSSASSE